MVSGLLTFPTLWCYLMILCSNPRASYISHQNDIDAAMRRVLTSGHYILGSEVLSFEAEFASYCETRFGIGVNNGTDAIQIALRACQIGPGDEVITVSHTAVATASAIAMTGATPIFIDIDDTDTMDPSAIEAAITPRTKAIVPVHLYGFPAAMNPIKKIATTHNLRIIEDCAQAHGARYHGTRVGGIGDMGCFSFYPTKNLGGIGDGGMIVTNDPALADRARAIREYGWNADRISEIGGINSRLDALQAAILRVKLRALDSDNQKRSDIAARYRDAIPPEYFATILPQTVPVYHLFVIHHPDRDALKTYLNHQGIGAAIHYTPPIHLHPAYSTSSCLPRTERAAQSVLSLPIYPELDHVTVDRIASLVTTFNKR